MFWLAVIMATAKQDNVNVRTQKHAEPKAHKGTKSQAKKKIKNTRRKKAYRKTKPTGKQLIF